MHWGGYLSGESYRLVFVKVRHEAGGEKTEHGQHCRKRASISDFPATAGPPTPRLHAAPHREGMFRDDCNPDRKER